MSRSSSRAYHEVASQAVSVNESCYRSGRLRLAGTYARLFSRGRDVPRLVLRIPVLAFFRRGLPRMEVRVSDGTSGAFIAAHLDRTSCRVPRFRLAQGALQIPADFASYSRGQHRQALRTNNRRARERGITCDSTRACRRGPGPPVRRGYRQRPSVGWLGTPGAAQLLTHGSSWTLSVPCFTRLAAEVRQRGGCSIPRSSSTSPLSAVRSCSPTLTTCRSCRPVISTSSICSDTRSLAYTRECESSRAAPWAI